MQIIAMATMLIDHIGLLFFPHEPVWRIIGRLAFPLYAFGIALGYRHTRSRRKYLIRLFAIALLSQVPYSLGLHMRDINVVGTFAVCLTVLMLFERIQAPWGRWGLAAAACILLEVLPFDYGAYALVLILIYLRANRDRWIAAHMVLNALYLAIHPGWVLQLFSIAATILLVYGQQLVAASEQIRVPRWLWRSFYPAHLAALALAIWMIKGN
ncbi:TraX family protein [Cohnella xylanilytica]|uniref:TraX family protein n=1 Tax=Cohnella xylanilytica TaxID=557555 RepID=UPI001BB319C5|nr:TraX family protein [Cohnella xylanilytica]